MNDKSKMPGWRRIALPVSIILNVFLIALIGGHVWQNQMRGERRGGPSLVRALANAESILSPQDAAAFGAVMRRDASHYVASWQKLLEARRALEDQLAAEHFDTPAAQQAWANWRDARDRFFDDLSNTLIEALAQTSPEGRRKLVTERGWERTPTPPPH
jgi:uncharacterized membrane protein